MLPREDGGVSPARRLLLTGLAAVVLLAAAVLVVLRVTGSDPASPAVAQDRPGPVLLVPGYGGSTAALSVLAARLRAQGRDARVVALPGDGTGDLAEAARVLGRAASERVAAGAPSVDVVGYSAGGVVARLWVRDEGGAALARRVVTLGAPHHGTGVAQLAVALAPGACPQACRQLVPSSPLLTALNRGDETPAGPQWLSLWSPADTVVTPPDSARLDGAVDVALDGVCADARPAHGDLPRDPLVTGIVLRALGPAPVAAPVAADCASLRAGG